VCPTITFRSHINISVIKLIRKLYCYELRDWFRDVQEWRSADGLPAPAVEFNASFITSYHTRIDTDSLFIVLV